MAAGMVTKAQAENSEPCVCVCVCVSLGSKLKVSGSFKFPQQGAPEAPTSPVLTKTFVGCL